MQFILDTAIQQLLNNPERRFIYVEIAFFKRWFDEQTSERKQQVAMLVNSGKTVCKVNCKIKKKIISSLYLRHCTEACNKWSGPNALLRGMATGQHSSKESWQAVGVTVPTLPARESNPQTSHTGIVCLTSEVMFEVK